MKGKWLLLTMVVSLFLSGSTFAINDQSLKSENTFGLLEDNFDLFQYPEYLADYKGYEVYTNLHNTSGANSFQIGGFGLPENVPGKLFVMFDTTRYKYSDWVYLPGAGFTPNWPNFINPGSFGWTGELGFFNRAESSFFDDNGDYKSDRSIVRNVSGESWTEISLYELALGYGISINPELNLGAGLFLGFGSGEAKDSFSTFDISYIETDLNTGTVTDNYSDSSKASIDVGASTIGFMVGAKFDPAPKTKIGVDLSYAILGDKGDGTYESSQRNAVWTRNNQTATLSESLSGAVADPVSFWSSLPRDGSNIGLRAKTYIPVAGIHTIRIDGGLNIASLDVVDGRGQSITTTSIDDPVASTRTNGQETDVVDYSGKNGSGLGVSALVADVVEATKDLQIAFGIGFSRNQTTVDVKRLQTSNLVERVDQNGDGDAIGDVLDYDAVNGVNETRTTDESSREQSYKNEITTTIIRIPLAADIQLTNRLNLRLGVEHAIIAERNDETIALSAGSYQTKTTSETGDGTRTVSYTTFSVPNDTKSSRVDVTSNTDYRIGLGIQAAKNLVIDLLADYYQNWDYESHYHELSMEPHEANGIYSIFASATIKF